MLGRLVGGTNSSSTKGLMFQIQSNLAIRNFFVTLKLFLNAKCSLFLWSKLAFGYRKWFLNTNLFLIKQFLNAKFDCTSFLYISTFSIILSLVLQSPPSKLHSKVSKVRLNSLQLLSPTNSIKYQMLVENQTIILVYIWYRNPKWLILSDWYGN